MRKRFEFQIPLAHQHRFAADLHACDLGAVDADGDVHPARAAHLHALQAEDACRPAPAARHHAAPGSSPSGPLADARGRDPRTRRARARTSGCTPSPRRGPARGEKTNIAWSSTPAASHRRVEGARGSATRASTAARVASGKNTNGTPHDTSCTGRPVCRIGVGVDADGAGGRLDVRDDGPEHGPLLGHPRERGRVAVPVDVHRRRPDVQAEDPAPPARRE